MLRYMRDSVMDYNSINDKCQKKFFEKVNKYWLQLIEASMASMRVFEMFSLEFNIPKYMYNTCTFQNMIMNSLIIVTRPKQ